MRTRRTPSAESQRRHVPDDGAADARLIIIGEAPGVHEEAAGRPFVGPSGHLLTRWMGEVGVSRHDAYVTNVVPYRPDGNKIETVPPSEMAHWHEALHDRLAALLDPWLIVPTGNVALRALIGKVNITKHRGSIYGYTDRAGRTVKVIPTLHPAATFRAPAFESRCRRDWQRIAGDLSFRELRLPVREHRTAPTLADVQDFLADVQADGADGLLAIDIETPRESGLETVQRVHPRTGAVRETTRRVLGEPRIECVGFARSPAFSLTIPTTLAYWRRQADLDRAWAAVSALCASRAAKALQNGLFDAWWLARHGVRLARWQWDTLCLHHLLEPAEPHDLAYQASVCTRQPYWKDEAKDPDEMTKYASSSEALWTYNGIDAAVTRELAEGYLSRLDEAGLTSFSLRHYTALFRPLLGLMQAGILVDDQARRRMVATTTAALITAQDRLTELAGEPLYAKTGLSPLRVRRFLHDTLGLPIPTDRKTGRPTTKEVAIRRLMLTHPAEMDEPGRLILEVRRQTKVREFLDDARIDPDGRIRCSYGLTTDTGRLKSSRNPARTGANLQNQDRAIRSVYVPAPGRLFLEADLSQAEARVVAMLTRDPDLIEKARTPPWEYDVHTENASLIFGKPMSAVTKDERYLGKKAVHAASYGMRGGTLSDELLKDGFVRSPEECDVLIEAFMARRPAIPRWQAETRARVWRDRLLANSWGRVLTITDARFTDDTYRRAYAFVPQSEIADLLNQWGLVPMWAWLRATRQASQIVAQLHDALLIEAVPAEVWPIMQMLRQSLERPRRYAGGDLLTIPIEFKLGRTWAGDVAFKRPPDREELESAVASLAGPPAS